MPRQADQDRLSKIDAYVRSHPGSRPADIARELEISRSTVTRALPNLDDAGYLLSEDIHGGLWPFRAKDIR
jgi:Mn-dependent DtxR family transcriptional regulator